MTEYDQSFAELSDIVDEAHRTVAGGDNPSPNIWAQVRSQVIATKSQENPQMSTIAMQAGSVSTPARSAISSPPFPSRFASVAAAVVLVSALILSGWYAVMNLGPADGDNNNGIAFAPSTPTVGDAMCDIEPMTVDEVMATVKNPYSAYDRADITSRDQLALWEDKTSVELVEPLFVGLDLQLMDSFTYPASRADFEEATSRANGFLACAQFGSIGQLFNYMDPREIQRIVLSNHPVFRDEDGIQETVEELVQMPADIFVFPGRTTPPYAGLTLSVNPDVDSALTVLGNEATRYEATRLMMLGIVATDGEGTILYQGNADGSASPDDGLVRNDQFRLILKRSAIDGRWYILAVMPQTLYVN